MEDLVINFGDHMRKAQKMYVEGRQAIYEDKTLSRDGKQLKMEELNKSMQGVWSELESQYVASLNTADSDIKAHQRIKPLPTEPDEKTLRSERREYKKIAGQLALAKDGEDFLNLLANIQTEGNDIQKSALLVYFQELAQQAKSFISDMTEGNSKTLFAATTKIKLKELYTALSNDLKSERQIKWEMRMANLLDRRATIKGEFNTAFQLFQRNYKNIYGLALGQKQVIDPWSKHQAEDEPWNKQVSRMGGMR